MRKAHVILSLYALLGGIPAGAQATWNGLRFGMSAKEAKDLLAAKGAVMVAGDSLTLKSESDYLLRLGEDAKGFPLVLTLQFDAIGLKDITLQLDIQRYKNEASFSPSTRDSIATWIFGSIIYDELLTKYGSPIKATGDCKATPIADSELSGCEINWRGDSQMITLDAAYSAPYNAALIEYKRSSDVL